MLRPLALAVAALALAGCTNGSPRDAAPSPSSATPSATASVAAVATLRVRVESSAPADTVTAQVTARLAALGVTASHVDAAAGTIELPRALTAEELAAVRAPGRLTLRPVLRANPPGECATATGRAAVAARSAGAGAGAAIVACDAEGEATYDLGPAEITNADVASATVTDEPGGVATGLPVVRLELRDAAAWAALTGKLVGRQVAFVVDGVAESAPTIQERITEPVAQISGGDAKHLRLLGATLAAAPLPAGVTISQA